MKYPSSVPAWIPEHQGKVRDTFRVPGHDDLMFLVATDRVSTHNVVHESEISGKGKCLTALTVFWLKKLEEYGIRTHLVAYGKDIYRYIAVPETLPADLHLRCIVVRRMNVVPREFIFRARMAGSLWADYYSKGLPNPYGVVLPAGLDLMSPLVPIAFTPTEKSDTDDPVNAADVLSEYPEESETALQVYQIIRSHTLARGIDTIDAKGEMGRDPRTNKVAVVDEVGTPDCCRYVDVSDMRIGNNPKWLDKQFVREEAERIWKSEGGEKRPIAFGPETVRKTAEIYRDITGRILDMPLEAYQDEMFS
ncbi:MAG: hypothetical protein HGA31_05450 [Candidatus Moranbacteria bacterium]|nr:hypothetical protein [Candidatus Moranbacteria bacterium]